VPVLLERVPFSDANYRHIRGYQSDHPTYMRFSETGWGYWFEECPLCHGWIMHLLEHTPGKDPIMHAVFPKVQNVPRLPDIVPPAIADDFHEACGVFGISTKASAALARRGLQHVLQDYAKVQAKDLAPQIEEVLPTLPSYIAETIDMVRVLGNFAAHPIKSTHTGEVLNVQPGEAEATLEALRLAIDHYIIKPAETAKRRDSINAKLAEAGKPALE
jgi:Domain of unknown function (DUF4145)